MKEIIDSYGHCKLKPLVILANKADLNAARKITVEEGSRFASEAGCPFYEISARETFDDVEKVFRSAIELTMRCTMVTDQINRYYGPNSQRERKPSIKTIMSKLTRKNSIREETEEPFELPPRKDSSSNMIIQRNRTDTL